MYEFSKKEVRKKFVETEYGKKVNTWLYISGVIAVFFLVFSILSRIVSFSETIIEIIDIGFFISAVFVCYFDGKRDGAMEQFKRGK